MITVKENTTLAGVSELRTSLDQILEKAQKGPVIIEKRHRPAAVLLSSKEYEALQDILDAAEDIVLGLIAKKRFEKSTDKDYVDIEKLLK